MFRVDTLGMWSWQCLRTWERIAVVHFGANCWKCPRTYLSGVWFVWFVGFKRQSAPLVYDVGRSTNHHPRKRLSWGYQKNENSWQCAIHQLRRATKYIQCVSWTRFDKFGPQIDVGCWLWALCLCNVNVSTHTCDYLCIGETTTTIACPSLPCWSWTTFLFYWMFSMLKISPEHNVLHVSSFLFARNLLQSIYGRNHVKISLCSVLDALGTPLVWDACANRKWNSIQSKRKKKK